MNIKRVVHVLLIILLFDLATCMLCLAYMWKTKVDIMKNVENILKMTVARQEYCFHFQFITNKFWSVLLYGFRKLGKYCTSPSCTEYLYSTFFVFICRFWCLPASYSQHKNLLFVVYRRNVLRKCFVLKLSWGWKNPLRISSFPPRSFTPSFRSILTHRITVCVREK